MSDNIHKHTHPHQTEHGTARSYVIGFALSLLFTAIPYCLVVKQTVTGNVLLATILGFAVLQLIVQVVFFLHLGRERGPRWQLLFLMGTVAAIIAVVGGSIFIIGNLHHYMSPSDISLKLAEKEGISQVGGEKTGACQGLHTRHKVTIKDGIVAPQQIMAQRCDTIGIINEDDVVRKITFGTHPKHDAYGGEDEVVVRKGRPETIVLNQLGTYQYHDHLDPDAAGFFTVSPE